MLHSKTDVIFKYSNIGIIISDSEGFIKDVNPAISRILGYEHSELISLTIEDLLPQKIRKKHITYRDEYKIKPTPRLMGVGRDLYAQKKDKSLLPVEVSLCTFVDKGEKFYVSFINDITLRKESEQRLEQFAQSLEQKVEIRTNELSEALVELNHTNEKLTKSQQQAQQALENEKKTNELKSRFVSMASHEFRTPLAGILSSVNLIDKYIEIDSLEKVNRHINSIKRSVKGLTNILEDFLSLDKLEEGRVLPHLCSFNLSELLQQIVEDIQDTALPHQKISLNLHEQKVELYQDKEMIRNICLNLINNSLKYCKETGVLLVINVKRSEKFVEISFKDNGIGIPKEDQEYLFNRFFRAKNVMGHNGTGLGLNIVKHYCTLMGGEISFISEQGVGSTFSVKLPIKYNE
ncbi:MAG: PAS domain-containing sensor histidine kinase [Bacteriovoracaceae bacterium]|jgi:PAS domain S-box-containing protein|nr:PAS domain-containing sensor histidine kinase [Bacteriovoracaceae bacterium]